MADIDQIIAGGAGASSRATIPDFSQAIDAYFDTAKKRAAYDLQQAFKDGVPTDANGQPDFGAMAKVLFQKGGLNEGVAASNIDLQRQKLQYNQKTDAVVHPTEGLQSTEQPISPPSSNRNASAVVAPPLNRGGLNGNTSQPTQQQGGATIMQVLSAQGIPNDQLQAAGSSVARQLGVDDPNAPIDLNDPRVRNVIGPAVAQLKRMGIGQVVPQAVTPQGAPPQPMVSQQTSQMPPQGVPQPQPQAATFDQRFAGIVPRGRTAEQQLLLLNRALGSGMLSPETAKAYEAERAAILKRSEPTSEEQAYQASQRNPKLDEYTASKAADAETAKAVAASNVKEQNTIIDAGRAASQRLTTLNTVANIVQGDKDLTLGFGAETALKIKKALQQIGFNVGNLSGAQAIEKLNGQLAAESAKTVSPRPAQFEFKTFLNNNPGLNLDKAGNLRVIGIFSQLAKRDVDLGRLARMNRDNWSSWDSVVTDYDKAHPILDPVTKTPLSTDSVIAPGPQQGQSSPQRMPPPEPGKTMINGYRYKGGNPKDRANWEQVS